jgi:hypothetical protein
LKWLGKIKMEIKNTKKTKTLFKIRPFISEVDGSVTGVNSALGTARVGSVTGVNLALGAARVGSVTGVNLALGAAVVR